MHVLFVCTGNICRSPMAERLAIAHGSRLHIPNLTTASAGTHAVIGHPIHEYAVAVLEKLGGDASNFAAQQLKPKSAYNADLILTMTRAHRDAVLELAPRKLHRTFTLHEAARLATECGARNIADLSTFRSQLASYELDDIPDPVGGNPRVFAEVGRRINELLPPIVGLWWAGHDAD